ncbi:MAG: glucose-6-phosphate isomerase [Devosia nanyangense]|uniref:Glucose-6-phosphate isomerase n=1 Tax=Devosia nanyangense TaxID=1228055 RepID=A0A933L214_9HYPH|nr:glucose-6-phosphate isomerase [Devosia nanyangense]
MASNRKSLLNTMMKHRKRLDDQPMRLLFALDPNRFRRFSVSAGDLLLDYSKNRIDEKAMDALFALARAADFEGRRKAMWAGKHINSTEDRAVMHMALRYQGDKPVKIDGRDVMPDVREVLAHMKLFTSQVRDGTIRGTTGEKFTDIVNIGIGGSDLGPVMATLALAPYTRPDLRSHYVSNVDGAQLHDTLQRLDPKRTMFIVASKTFTTDETMTNAASARAWVATALGDKAVSDHFAAVSTNLKACDAFGIREDRIFGFWDWVGGRYSVWSAIGLPVALAVGFDNFSAFLAGAYEMDQHFLKTRLEKNLPVIMGLLGVWYRNAWGFATHAVLPYDQRLSRFPAYLQQQDMESNGKQVNLEGKPLDYDSGPVIWGEPGTNGQHAFYQLIHQGTSVVPADFLIAANPHEDMAPHHEKLVANVLAQSEALMLGKTREEVVAELTAQGLDKASIKALTPHKMFPGNRPSNTLIYPKLTPAMLGSLVALYEHKVFVQGTIWNVNSYDQWGVELGKQLAKAILPKVQGTAANTGNDASTKGLLAHYHKLRG